ncbi:MAG: 50S ribosomal protein L4 [Eubacteriales bacterium]
MQSIKVYNMKGEEVETINISDEIFAAEINKPALHAVVKAYLSNQRQGTQSTLTRAEVSGGGRKPWRQKGTGRARHGSIRSPQWTHGGVAFGPKPRKYKLSVNKKIKRTAMFSALTSKVSEGSFIVVDNITLDEYKTKTFIAFLEAIGALDKSLVVLDKVDDKVIKSAANIPAVTTMQINTINVYEILRHNKMVITKEALLKLEEVYA